MEHFELLLRGAFLHPDLPVTLTPKYKARLPIFRDSCGYDADFFLTPLVQVCISVVSIRCKCLPMEFNIHSKAEYDAAMETIREMMSRGEDNLSESERSSFFRIAVAIERFEDYFLGKVYFSPYTC